jgi:fucose 4-O-acetylase-like acetyltransferase
MKTRNRFLDICKFIAIFLVVFGHCIQYGQGIDFLENELYYDNLIFKIIYSFHMPLFMIISGYLFSYSIKRNNSSTIIKNKFKQLVVPLFFWGLISTFVVVISRIINKTELSFIFIIKELIVNFICGPWFLWAVWWCSVIVVIVYKYFKNSPIVFVLGLVLTFVLPDIYGLDMYKYMYPYFIIAYYFGYYNLYDKYKNVNHFIRCIIIVLYIFSLKFYDNEMYIYISGYSILGENVLNQLYIDLYRFYIGLIGSATVLILTSYLYIIINDKIKNLFAYMGKNSLGIYLISDYVNTYLLQKITYSCSGYSFLRMLVEAIAVIVICLTINNLFKRNKVLNRCLLGGRI